MAFLFVSYITWSVLVLCCHAYTSKCRLNIRFSTKFTNIEAVGEAEISSLRNIGLIDSPFRLCATSFPSTSLTLRLQKFTAKNIDIQHQNASTYSTKMPRPDMTPLPSWKDILYSITLQSNTSCFEAPLDLYNGLIESHNTSSFPPSIASTKVRPRFIRIDICLSKNISDICERPRPIQKEKEEHVESQTNEDLRMRMLNMVFQSQISSISRVSLTNETHHSIYLKEAPTAPSASPSKQSIIHLSNVSVPSTLPSSTLSTNDVASVLILLITAASLVALCGSSLTISILFMILVLSKMHCSGLFIPMQVAIGEHHTCALSQNNTIKCWGYNFFGQLGYGDTRNRGDEANQMGDSLRIEEMKQMKWVMRCLRLIWEPILFPHTYLLVDITLVHCHKTTPLNVGDIISLVNSGTVILGIEEMKQIRWVILCIRWI
eukprot:111358_1